MTRILLTYLVPLVLPTIAWYVWNRLAGPKAPGGGRAGGWSAAPWPALCASGVALLAATLGALALLTGAEPGEVYAPARFVDGEIAPGSHETPAAAPVAAPAAGE